MTNLFSDKSYPTNVVLLVETHFYFKSEINLNICDSFLHHK